MAGNVDFTYTVGFMADTSAMTSKIKIFSEALKKPIDLKLQLPGMDSTAAQKMIDSIQAAGVEMTSLQFKTESVEGKGKKVFTQLTQMVYTYRDALENTKTVTLSLENNVQSIKKNTTAFKSLSKSADEWLDRSKKMGKGDREGIESVVAALKKEIVAREKLAAINPNSKKIQKYDANILKLAGDLDALGNATRAVATDTQSWSHRMTEAVKNSMSYALSLGLIREAQQLLSQAIRYNIELNKEMIKVQVLQVEGARTTEEIYSLARGYNELAKQMGVSTIEVAKGSVEWMRQGKTIEETTELLKSSVMLGVLGNLDLASSTEYLTSVLNGYQMEASEAVSVVDKLIAVDNVAATSAMELAVALKYVSATAADAGVTFEQLVSYIGTISSVTRQKGEMIGQALKTIFTRMQDIKAGAIDEEGMGINNVALALERVDVKLMETETEFRDMGEVLEELAGKWNTLNEVEQANIAKAVAGVRQQNMFRILMANMTQALELQAVQFAATGLAAERYDVYLQGLEAAGGKLKAAFEGLMTSEELVKTATAIINMVTGIVEYADSLENLAPKLLIVIGLLIAFNRATVATAITSLIANVKAYAWLLVTTLRQALTAATAATTGWASATAVATAGISILIGVIALVIASQKDQIETTEETAQSVLELLTSYIKLKNEIKDTEADIENITELIERYEELTKIENLTVEAQEELIRVQNDLAEVVPGVIEKIDSQGNAIEINTGKVYDNIEAQQRYLDKLEEIRKAELPILVENQAGLIKNAEADLKAQEAILEKVSELKEGSGITEYAGSFKFWGYDQESGEVVLKQADSMSDAMRILNQDWIDQALAVSNAEKIVNDATLAYDNLHAEMIAGQIIPEEVPEPKQSATAIKLEALIEYEDKLKQVADIEKKIAEGNLPTKKEAAFLENQLIEVRMDEEGQILSIAEATDKWTASQQEAFDELHNNGVASTVLIDKLEELRGTLEEEAITLNDVTSSFKMLSEAMAEQDENGSISLQTALQMIEAGYGSALAFDTETNAIRINVYALKDAVTAKAELAIVTAQLNYDASKAVDAYSAETMALYNLWQMAKATAEQLRAIPTAIFGSSLGVMGSTPTPSSGASAPKDTSEKDAIDAQIKSLERKKDALKDASDEFKDYINLQKDSLRLAKEEEDFKDELEKKSKSLARLKTEIILLSLDDSEEARSQRLDLEEEAAELETDINEDKEDRIYDLKIEALDKAQEAFEKNIQAQIDGIDREIDSARDLASAISGGSAGTSGGGGDSIAGAYVALSAVAQQVQDILDKNYRALYLLSEKRKQEIRSEMTRMAEAGQSALQMEAKLLRILALYRELDGQRRTFVSPGGDGADLANSGYHTGGIVESHHAGSFAGGLKSNEVFSKLLKGEYVSTEDQMNNFMKNTLPKIASYPIGNMIGGNGDVTMEIAINVAGSFDKTVMPELRASFMEEANKVLRMRGVRRNASSMNI